MGLIAGLSVIGALGGGIAGTQMAKKDKQKQAKALAADQQELAGIPNATDDAAAMGLAATKTRETQRRKMSTKRATILTGPSGLTDTPVARKSLLGS